MAAARCAGPDCLNIVPGRLDSGYHRLCGVYMYLLGYLNRAAGRRAHSQHPARRLAVRQPQPARLARLRPHGRRPRRRRPGHERARRHGPPPRQIRPELGAAPLRRAMARATDHAGGHGRGHPTRPLDLDHRHRAAAAGGAAGQTSGDGARAVRRSVRHGRLDQLARGGVRRAGRWLCRSGRAGWTTSIGACRALWGSTPASFSSASVSFEDLICVPRPSAPTTSPIWFGAALTPRLVRRVAQFGQGWMPFVGPEPQPLEMMARGVAQLHDAHARCRVATRQARSERAPAAARPRPAPGARRRSPGAPAGWSDPPAGPGLDVRGHRWARCPVIVRQLVQRVSGRG